MWWVLVSTVWAVLCIDLAAPQPLHIAEVGSPRLECGVLVPTGRGLVTNLVPTSLVPTPTGRGLVRTKRQLNIRLTPFCSTSACLAQRAVGAGLLGAAGALA